MPCAPVGAWLVGRCSALVVRGVGTLQSWGGRRTWSGISGTGRCLSLKERVGRGPRGPARLGVPS